MGRLPRWSHPIPGGLLHNAGDMRTAMPQKGFTLLELMVALTIAGILLGLAVPAMGTFIRSSRLSGSSRDFVVDFAVARNEAVQRATTVTVCTSADLATCSNASWNDGRLIFVDGGAAGVVDGGDLILSVTQPLNASLVTGAAGIAVPNFISFTAMGRVANVGQITVCAPPDQQQRNINIRRSGSATLDRTVIAC